MKKLKKYNLPPWVKNIKSIVKQFIIPFCIFQGIRTFLIPTTVDLLFLAVLILIAIGFQTDMI